MIYFTTMIFIIAPILSLPFSVIGLFTDEKRKKVYMLMIAFVIGIVSFYFPHQNYNIDLNVYETQVSALKELNFDNFIGELFKGKEYLTNTIFWILAQLDYFDFWKFIVAFFGYSIIGVTLIEYGEKNKFTNNMINFLLILMWLMYNKLNLILGLRNELAFTIFVFAVYIDIIKENKNKILKLILYLVPITIHQSTIILVAIRILLPLFMRNSLFGYIPMICYALSHNVIIFLASKLSGIPMFGDILAKLGNYSYGIKDAIGNNTLITINLLITIVYFIILILYKKDALKDTTETSKKIYNLAELMLLFGICSFNYYHVFIRFINFSMPLVAMAFILIIDFKKYTKNSRFICFLIGILAISLGILQYKEIIKYSFSENLIENIYKNIFIILGGN